MTGDHDIERLLREDRDALSRGAKIPSAGLVYWRASIRARAEAARKAEHPLTITQGVAVAAVAGVGAAMGGLAWHFFEGFEPPQLGLASTIALAAAALAVLSPLALVALASRARFHRPQD